MTLKKFELLVDNPAGIYYSGQLVTGKVVIQCTRDKSIECITLHVVGDASVYWCEHEDKKTHKQMVHYQNRESYFNQNFLLLGCNRRFLIKSGSHVFPFKFQLPQNLPSSFDGEHGHVKYKLRCVIQRPKKKSPETLLDINVISLFNLNIVSDVRKSVFLNRCKQIPGDDDIEQGIVNVCLTTLKSGFVPGETILVNAEIRNCSSRVIKRIGLQLVSVETYKSKLRTTTTRNVLSITRYENCRIYPGHFLEWNDVCLVVPQRLPPSGLPSCSIIGIKYILELFFKPSGNVPLMTFPAEIILGTIPLKQKYPATRRSRSYEKLSTSYEDLSENLRNEPRKPRPRSKSISCRSEHRTTFQMPLPDPEQSKKQLARLKYGSESHISHGSGTCHISHGKNKTSQFGSETTLNRSKSRELARSRDNIGTRPRSRARSAQHTPTKRLLAKEPQKEAEKTQATAGSSRNGSSSSTSTSEHNDLYQRYHKPETKLTVLEEDSKQEEHDYITLEDNGRYLTREQLSNEQELIKVLENGSWDEDTFTKLLMSG